MFQWFSSGISLFHLRFTVTRSCIQAQYRGRPSKTGKPKIFSRVVSPGSILLAVGVVNSSTTDAKTANKRRIIHGHLTWIRVSVLRGDWRVNLVGIVVNGHFLVQFEFFALELIFTNFLRLLKTSCLQSWYKWICWYKWILPGELSGVLKLCGA